MGAVAAEASEATARATKRSRLKRAFRWANEHSALFTVFVAFLTFVASTGVDLWKTPAETAVLEAEAREKEERVRASRQASVDGHANALHARILAYEAAVARLPPDEQRFVSEARGHEAAAQGRAAENDFEAAERHVADGYAALANVRTTIPDLPAPPSPGGTKTPLPGAGALVLAVGLAALALRRREADGQVRTARARGTRRTP